MKDNKILTLNEIKLISKDVFIKHRLVNVCIFGSYAKGMATYKSDIDFLIKLKDGSSLFDLYDLKEDLKRKLKRKSISSPSKVLKKTPYLITML